MVTTAKIKVGYFELACDFPYDELYNELKTLYKHTSRRIFMVCSSRVLFSCELYPESDDSDEDVGKMIVLRYDSMLQPTVDKILKRYGA